MKKNYALFTSHWLRASLFTAAISVLPYLGLQAQTVPSKMWNKTCGGAGGETLTLIKQTTDGGYIMAGSSDSGISGDKTQASRGGLDYWIVKTDASGAKLWDKTFGGSSEDNLQTIQQTADGGYILGGYSNSPVSGDKTQGSKSGFDYWIVKLDALGNKTWDKNIGANAIDQLYALQQITDGGYILAGTSTSGIGDDKSTASKGGTDYWVVKLNVGGGLMWEKSFGGNGADALYAVQQTADGGYILAGNSASGISGDKSQASNGLNDYWVVKIDANGIKTWDKAFGGSADDVMLNAVQQTTDGGYILGGSSNSDISGDKTENSKGPTGAADYWVVKIDANGIKTWDKTIGGSGADNLRSLQQVTDGGYILGGTSASGIGSDKTEASKGGNDYWIVRLNSNGSKSWDKNLGGSGVENFGSLQQTTDGGFILGGSSDSGLNGDKTEASKGGNDFWAVKLNASGPAGPSDVSVTAIPGQASGCVRTGQETISVIVENKGTASQSNIPVSYKINNGNWITESIPGPLAPNAAVSYPFFAQANFSAVGTYVIRTKTALAGDLLAANDSLNQTITLAAAPAAPSVTAGGPTTFCTGGNVNLTASSTTTGVTYQWFKDGVVIGNANAASYLADVTGSYTVTALSSGCAGPASAATSVTLNPTPIAPILSASGPLAICANNGAVIITVTSVPGAVITWRKDNVVIPNAINLTYTASVAGSYTAQAMRNNCTGPISTAMVVTNIISPATPTISQAGQVLTSSSATGNQWYLNGVLIPNATNRTFTMTANGAYTVVVTSNGCSSAPSNAFFAGLGVNDKLKNSEVKVYPNPSNGLFNVNLPKGKTYQLEITDLTGKVIQHQKTVGETEVKLQNQAKGIYVLKISGENGSAFRKLIVE